MEGEPRPKVRAKLPLGEERRGKVDKQGTRKNKDEKSPRLSSVVDLDAKDDYVVAMASDVRALKNFLVKRRLKLGALELKAFQQEKSEDGEVGRNNQRRGIGVQSTQPKDY